VGDIGADFVLEDGRYRFAKIVRSTHFSTAVGLLSAPLDQPGIDVREGDFLIAVDGQQVDASTNVWASFVGKVNRPVMLTVSGTAAGDAPRNYTVVPNAGTGALRNQHRGEANRRRVEALSGGRVAYVYIGGYNITGIDGVMRGLIGMRDRQALIIDQRNNGGGTTSDALIEALNRQPLYEYAYRYGDGFQTPPTTFAGPKVLITNETNFSAAETFALMFKLSRTGTVVGQRTGGGGIGAALFQPPLIDGGRIGIPNRAAYNPVGSWDIENNGVMPDISVEVLPRDWNDGRDPQLERALQVALEALKRQKPATHRHPPYPVHK
jgi:tricorn protease